MEFGLVGGFMAFAVVMVENFGLCYYVVEITITVWLMIMYFGFARTMKMAI